MIVNLLKNNYYVKNIEEIANQSFNYSVLKNKTIMITGITGLVGRYFVDLIMYKNLHDNLNCTIIGVSRNEIKIKQIFNEYLNNKNFEYIAQDVIAPINYNKTLDYIIHAASNTSPIQYATEPIETLLTNIEGTKNLLQLSKNAKVKKFIFVSTFEVYGNVENKNEISENDFGTLNCTTLRSCYAESKRASESLCEAFSEEENVNISIVRLARVFGPTMNFNSALATAQFIKNGIEEKNIILKSNGLQQYSYNYVADVITAILTVMVYGKDKEAYNVADTSFNLTLKGFTEVIAEYTKKDIIFELPNEIEKKGYSNTVMTVLNSDKLKKLGWKTYKDIRTRIIETIEILKNEGKS